MKEHMVCHRSIAANGPARRTDTNDMNARDDIYLIADELHSIADLGLHYAENDYDRERYARALSLSARLVAAIEKRTADEVMAEYEGSLPHATPYVAADAAVSPMVASS